MHIKKLQIHGVRNLQDVTLSTSDKINVFTGKNASGKTSFLEAIHILARTKSFRTPRIRDVISYNKHNLVVISELSHEKFSAMRLKVEKGEKANTLELNGEKLKTVSDLAKTIPIITITQDSQTLVTGTPKQRRHWLDWAMFHVEPGYLSSWKQYIKALRHRNILLKKGEKNEDMYRAWEGEMVKLSTNITGQRNAFVNQIAERVNTYFEDNKTENIEVKYYPGMPQEALYGDYLSQSREEDRERGYTQKGPHQADIKFLVNDKEIKKVFSRGQIKIFINQLLITQASVTKHMGNTSPIILMDDYTAELDKNNSEYLLQTIKNQQFQTFITTTDQVEAGPETAVFHVEHGKTKEKSGF